MSLEAHIEKLVDVLERVIVAFEGGSQSAPAKGTAEPEPEAKAPAKRGRPAKAEKAETAKKKPAAKTEAPTDDDIRAVFGAFMGVDDVDEREARKTFVKKVLKKFGVEKATALEDDDRQAAIDLVEAKGKELADAGDEDDDLV